MSIQFISDYGQTIPQVVKSAFQQLSTVRVVAGATTITLTKCVWLFQQQAVTATLTAIHSLGLVSPPTTSQALVVFQPTMLREQPLKKVRLAEALRQICADYAAGIYLTRRRSFSKSKTLFVPQC